MAAGAIENAPSGWDLLMLEDEWGIYTLGEIRRLAEIAGVPLKLPAIILADLLRSSVVADTMEQDWISSVRSLDEVYLDLILEFKQEQSNNGVHSTFENRADAVPKSE